MTITFISNIKQNGKDAQKIKFSAALERSKYKDYEVLEFTEPENNILNRIEYKNDEVSIFTGPSTMNLKLNEDLKILYKMEAGVVTFVSHMYRLDIQENKIEFEYTLSHQDSEIGNYHITLIIKK